VVHRSRDGQRGTRTVKRLITGGDLLAKTYHHISLNTKSRKKAANRGVWAGQQTKEILEGEMGAARSIGGGKRGGGNTGLKSVERGETKGGMNGMCGKVTKVQGFRLITLGQHLQRKHRKTHRQGDFEKSPIKQRHSGGETSPRKRNGTKKKTGGQGRGWIPGEGGTRPNIVFRGGVKHSKYEHTETPD